MMEGEDRGRGCPVCVACSMRTEQLHFLFSGRFFGGDASRCTRSFFVPIILDGA